MNGDQRLVREYLRGKAAAFDRLFARHEAALGRFAYHLTGNRTEAEDLCQSTWLAATQSLSTYAGHSTFRAWLHGIALNLYRDQRRKPSLHTVALDPELPSARGESDPQRAAERAETTRRLRAALATLDEEHREVILLVKVQGLSYQEAAVAMNCPVGTIRSRVHYAMAALRGALEVHHEVR
jgi:RNA polymerase sigma-70 factor, ECF subfamily